MQLIFQILKSNLLLFLCMQRWHFWNLCLFISYLHHVFFVSPQSKAKMLFSKCIHIHPCTAIYTHTQTYSHPPTHPSVHPPSINKYMYSMKSFIMLFQKPLSSVIEIQHLTKPIICPHLIYCLLGRETTNK